ncbi:unnamed protein product, partial [Ectocarpus sp. 12 AP-2014]
THFQIIFIIIGFLSELLGPVLGWYVNRSKIPIHSNHVIERHGLFTIILLGECLVAIFSNFNSVIQSEHWYILIISFVIILCLWWLYFDCGYGYSSKLSKNAARVFEFGYGQFFVYLSVALAGIALEYSLHSISGHSVHYDILPGQIVMCSVGFFIFALSAVQLFVSKDKPFLVYVPRIMVSITLIGLGVLSILKENKNFIVLTLFLLLLLTINDVYQWAKFNLEKSKKQT